jgi:hypothetical protein
MARARTDRLFCFVANMLDMITPKKETMKKVLRKSYDFMLMPFKPTLDSLGAYYSQLKS